MKTIIALVVASFALHFHVAVANETGSNEVVGTEVAKKTKKMKKAKKPTAAPQSHTDAAPAAETPGEAPQTN
jgi:hypothetical protein